MEEQRETYCYPVGGFFVLPEHKLKGFHIVFSAEAVKAVGLLEKATKVFSSRKIPIVFLRTSIHEKGASTIIFVDLTNREIDINDVVAELKKIDYVKDVKVVDQLASGVIVDQHSFPPMIANERALILREPVYTALFKDIKDKIGEEYSVLLYFMGFQVGQKMYQNHLKIAGGDINKALKIASATCTVAGYGLVEVAVLDLKKRIMECIVHRNFECELYLNQGRPASHFMRGMVAGWFAAICGVSNIDKVEAKEIECIAKGDKYCRFHVTIKD